MVKIGSARSNEMGEISGGQPGDQKGGAEVSTQDWYLHGKGWVVIRAKDSETREKIAKNMEAACANDHIGYCQTHRTSLTVAAKPYGYDASKVSKNVETDCSELVRVCCLYAGISVGSFATSGEVSALRDTGKFEIFTDDKHCKSSDNLLRGDILVTKTKGHTVVVLSNGSEVLKESTTTTGSVSKPVAAKSFSKSIAGKYEAISDLNMRQGPSTEHPVVTVLKHGDSAQCYGYYTRTGFTNWYLVSKSGKTGYCSSKYLKKA